MSDDLHSPKTMVIKVTNQFLQQNHLAQIGKETVAVHEDIIFESGILKHLSEDKQCPKSIVKFNRFFKTLSRTNTNISHSVHNILSIQKMLLFVNGNILKYVYVLIAKNMHIMTHKQIH